MGVITFSLLHTSTTPFTTTSTLHLIRHLTYTAILTPPSDGQRPGVLGGVFAGPPPDAGRLQDLHAGVLRVLRRLREGLPRHDARGQRRRHGETKAMMVAVEGVAM